MTTPNQHAYPYTIVVLANEKGDNAEQIWGRVFNIQDTGEEVPVNAEQGIGDRRLTADAMVITAAVIRVGWQLREGDGSEWTVTSAQALACKAGGDADRAATGVSNGDAVVSSISIRGRFEVEANLPGLSTQSYQRVVKDMRRTSLSLARKRIATPSRRRFPRRTGLLRSARGGLRGSRLSRRAAVTRSGFTVFQFKVPFYAWFQDSEWRQFRATVTEEAGDIIAEALADALRKEMMR